MTHGKTDIRLPEYAARDELGDLREAAAVFLQKNIELKALLHKSRTLGEALELSRRRLRVAADSAGIGVWDLNHDDGTLHFDANMLRLYGLEGGDEMDVARWKTQIHIDDVDGVEQALQDSIREQTHFDTIFRILHPRGLRYIKAYAMTIYDDTRPQHTIGVNYDITEFEQLKNRLQQRVDEEVAKQREQEQVLIQQSKLASMGEMISAISHQWRQPLNAVSLYLQDLLSAQRYGELDEAYLKGTVEKGLQQIEYMSGTIDDFRNFFSPKTRNARLDVRQIIEDSLRLFEAQLRNNDITYEFHYDALQDYALHGNANHLKQALANLLSNAIDAIKAQKRQRPGHVGNLQVILTQSPHTVVMKLDDNGIGIPAALLQRVFEPYFTTKDEGEGSGIGLYMSQTILQKYFHGKISLQPLSQGTRAVVVLAKGEA